MKDHFESGITRSYSFRRDQLLKLRSVLLKYEKEIYEALYEDLRKCPEEVYASELGLVLSEIKTTLRYLKQWMEPKTVPTEMVNLPSSCKIYRDPLGVVLIIGPWNYPLQLMLTPLVGAIAGGNCVLLKPSEYAGATSSLITKMITEIFPQEYVKVVEGEGAIVIPQLMNDFRFDYIFYTGSVPVGKLIYKAAAEQLIPVTLELGGKSPGIVEADANLNVAARRLTLGKFLNAGQTCVAPDYVLVHESAKDKLVMQMKIAIEKFYSAESSESYGYGRIINEHRFDKLISYLQTGTILYGGRHDRSRRWIEPTIMENISPDSPLLNEEIFGPILPFHTFSNTDEAMRVVKQNPNPLALYLFTNSSKKQKHWIENTPFGGGSINETAWYFANKSFPFGGVGNSGIGAYHGKYSFETFTREKPVMKSPTWLDPDIKYPPLKGKLKLYKMFIR